MNDLFFLKAIRQILENQKTLLAGKPDCAFRIHQTDDLTREIDTVLLTHSEISELERKENLDKWEKLERESQIEFGGSEHEQH
jgi:hypothetical protein